MKYKGFWIVVAIFLVATGIISVWSYQNRQPLVYREHLDKIVLTVDDREMTLGDLAYYIAMQELAMDEQASVYDMENKNAYWGLRFGSHGFVKTEAKEMILDTAIHDEIFYQMAVKEGILLDEEEQRLLELKHYDFWSDLTEEQRKRIGVDKEQLKKRMEEISVAQKYQFLYALENSVVSEDYECNGEGYLQLLEEHEVQTDNSVWNRVPFGEVIVDSREIEETEHDE